MCLPSGSTVSILMSCPLSPSFSLYFHILHLSSFILNTSPTRRRCGGGDSLPYL